MCGVGTSTPFANFVLNGSVVSSGGDIFQIASSTNQSIVLVTNNGLVGIGTSTPGSILSVNNSVNFVSGSGATSSIYGFLNVLGTNSTSTFSGNLSVQNLNVGGAATSTFNNGINILTGCFSVNGACLNNIGLGANHGPVSRTSVAPSSRMDLRQSWAPSPIPDLRSMVGDSSRKLLRQSLELSLIQASRSTAVVSFHRPLLRSSVI